MASMDDLLFKEYLQGKTYGLYSQSRPAFNPGISIKRTVCLSLSKESPNLFSKLNPLYTDTSPSVSLLAGFDCI